MDMDLRYSWDTIIFALINLFLLQFLETIVVILNARSLFINRQNWVGRIDTHDSHFLAIAIAEQQLLQAEFEDCISVNSSGVTCCRTIALIVRQRSPFFFINLFLFAEQG